jgi:hypothetical protein
MLNFIRYFSGSMAYMEIIWTGLLSNISNMKSTNKHVKEKCKKNKKSKKLQMELINNKVPKTGDTGLVKFKCEQIIFQIIGFKD